VVFLGAVAAICGLTVAVGLAPLRVFEHDVFFALDGAYRVLHGQVPHRDFSAWCPLFFLIDAAGLAISGMRPAGLGYANALWSALVAIWAYGIARSRLGSGLACVAGIYTLLLIVGPYALGFHPLSFSHAMGYNRYGFALLGIVLMECAGPSGRAGAASSGAAWALMSFVKISYGVLAVPFLLFAWVYSGARRQRLLWLSLAAGAVALAMLCYLRFDFADLLHDLAAAASGRSRTWDRGKLLTLASFCEGIPLVLLAVAVCAKSTRAARLRVCALAAMTLAVSAIFLSTNHQRQSLPLAGFAALVLAGEWLTRWKAEKGESSARKLGIVLLMGLSTFPLALANLGSMVAAAVEERRLPPPAADRLTSVRGASMVFQPVMSSATSETGGAAYVEALNDGLSLIRRRTDPGAGVLAMDHFNPFNYLLDRRPPRGGLAASTYNFAYSDDIHPSADRFFGYANYVIVRKYSTAYEDYASEEYHLHGLDHVYGAALRERFRMIEETEHWSLWQRR
jgi:hypothetical protein